MIIEGRQITTLEELDDFCKAAIAAAKVKPHTVRLSKPLALRLCQHEDAIGRQTHTYDLVVC